MKRLLAVLILLTGALWAQTVTPSVGTKVYSLAMNYSTSTTTGTGYTAPWSTTWVNTELNNAGERCSVTSATSCLSIYTANSNSALYAGTYGNQPSYMTYNSLGGAGVCLVNNNGTSTTGYCAYGSSASNPSTTTAITVAKCSNISTNTCTTLQTYSGLSISWLSGSGTGWALSDAGGIITLYVSGAAQGTPISDSTYTPTYAAVYQSAVTTSNIVGTTYFEYGTLSSSAAAPSFSPAAGNFTSYPQTVTITSSTSGVTICSTTDGSTPAASTAGTCSHGTSISNGGTVSISTTVNLQAIATESGYANSAVTSGTYYLLPTISLASGIYTSTQTATISCPYSLCYYTVDGSTPTTGSSSVANGGTVTVAHTELLTVEAIGGSSNTQATAEYVLPNETALVTDNFQSYYNSNLIGNSFQLPLDVWDTSGSYDSLAGLSTYFQAIPDTIRGGSNVMLASVGSNLLTTRTQEGYPNNQGEGINIHPGSGISGVGVGCNTSNCVTLEYTTGYLYLADTVTSTYYKNGAYSLSDGALLQLYRVGCHVYPFVNGATPTGWSSFYTVSNCTGGAPALVSSGSTGGNLYNLSTYATTTTSGYTPPSVAYGTFTDAMNTSGWSPTAPWYRTQCCGTWIGYFGGEPIAGGGYGVGPNGSTGAGSQYEYRYPYGINQWQAFTVTINSWDGRIYNWIAPILHQALVPGLNNGGCTAAGTTASCFDPISYYFSMNGNDGRTGGLGATTSTQCANGTIKDKDACAPWAVLTKVTPVASPGDQVITVQSSNVVVNQGDKVYVEYNNGWLNAYCQRSATALPTWATSTAYTQGSAIVDSNGHIQLVYAGGTSGTVSPTFATSWDGTNYMGHTVTDGTVTWEYYGNQCPASAASGKYAQIIHAYDTDMLNPTSTAGGLTHALGIGFPSIWGQCVQEGTSNTPIACPLYTGWSSGTLGYGTGNPCGVNGSPSSSCPASSLQYVPQSFIP